MDKREIRERCAALFEQTPGNVLRPTDKIARKYVGTAMFDAPLVGFGSAHSVCPRDSSPSVEWRAALPA